MPYTDVIVSLDCLNHYNPNLWALAKIKAYQSIKEPFIHVDGDVFIWTKIDESLKNHDLIVQNEETTTDYYGKMWRDIRHAISYMPEEMKRYDLHIDNKAYNMGIFGGTDIDFIQRYTYKAFDFSSKSSNFHKIPLVNHWIFRKISYLCPRIEAFFAYCKIQKRAEVRSFPYCYLYNIGKRPTS